MAGKILENAHSKSVNEVLEEAKSGSQGLSVSEAQERLNTDGLNIIAQAKKQNVIIRSIIHTLKDVFIDILIAAGIIALIIAIIEKNGIAEFIDAAIIFLVVIVNTVIGLINEVRAERAMNALRSITKPFIKALRGGETVFVKTEELVIGDIVLLEAGDVVPADLRLISVNSLKIEEAALTGESIPSEKFTDSISKPNLTPGDKYNIAYMGGTIAYGRGKGVVVATGEKTEIGKIAQLLENTRTQDTPLQRRLKKTAYIVAGIILVVSLLVFALDMINGHTFISSLILAIAVAVGAIPEGLPASVTIIMALGVQNMAQRKAIVRTLPSVETLGSTQIICSDKTGTLTLNKMTVKEIFTENSLPYSDINKNFMHLINCMLLCNDTELKMDDGGTAYVLGDPTEAALTNYALTYHFNKMDYDLKYPRISEIPFDSNRKLMSVTCKVGSEQIFYTKGAVDNLVKRCSHVLRDGEVVPLTDADRDKINLVNKDFAGKALRNLGFAYKVVNEKHKNQQVSEEDLIFLGLVGMIDPPREEVKDAVALCKQASIKTYMITGDHKDTAFAIAKEIGLAQSEEEVLTGAQIDEMYDEDFAAKILNYSVFARVSPEHKVKIVRTLKSFDYIVAMTGDGVNDAPSIKEADIGIGMGITGTQITKDNSDLILTDDNFATIVSAVGEGRRTFSNIMKVMQLFLATNLAETIIIFIVMIILKMPLFTPALILWINFVSDTLTALALGTERAEPDTMQNPPNKTRGNLFKGRVGLNIVYMSIVQACIVMAAFFIGTYSMNLSAATVTTMCFVTLVTLELFHSYNLRSEDKSIFTLRPFSNKWLNIAFLVSFFMTAILIFVPNGFSALIGLVPINAREWGISLAFAFLIIPIVEIVKIFIRMYERRKNSRK